MGDRGSMQGPRGWHSDRGSEYNNGGRSREDEDRRRRERGDEQRRDGPERYLERRERDDSRGSGPREPYGGRNSERSYGNDRWRGGGYGSSSGGGYGSSSDNPRREYPGAPQHAKQDTRPSEQQRAEEERRAQVARELQQAEKRREEEEYAAYMYAERVKQAAQRKREEERRSAKKEAKKKAKSRVWLGEHDDFAKARSSMKELARCIWYAHGKDVRVEGAPHMLRVLDIDVQKKIFAHLKSTEFETFEKFKDRFMDILLFDNTLFGEKFSLDPREVHEFLKGKIEVAGPGTALSERDVLALRLVECASDKGWLADLAELLAKDAEEVDRIERANTFSEVCRAFDATMKRSDGTGSLWTLSANIHANLVTFSNNMRRDMKVDFPKSKYAVKVVELARDRNWLTDLATYAANKEAGKGDDDGSDGLWE